MTKPVEKKFFDEPLGEVRRHWLCACGGEMRSIGSASAPPIRIWHACDRCGCKQDAPESYPLIVNIGGS